MWIFLVLFFAKIPVHTSTVSSHRKNTIATMTRNVTSFESPHNGYKNSLPLRLTAVNKEKALPLQKSGSTTHADVCNCTGDHVI